VEEKGVSVQMAARELRYQWFEEIREKEQYDFIATAHNRNDNLETILLNLVKGTDIHGLTGIKVKFEKIIRPLLFATREEILNYAKEYSLKWREDSSNLSTKYQRNFFRHEVIPLLKKVNPSIHESLENSLEKLKAAENIFNEKVLELKTRIVAIKNEGIFIDKKSLLSEKEYPVLFFELVREYGFGYQDCLNLLQSTQTGKKILSKNHEAVNDREFIIITPLSISHDQEYLIEKDIEKICYENFVLEFQHPSKGFKPGSDSEMAFLDQDKLKFPLKIRTWQEGDYFIPFGMKGKKKISDFLIDLKIPLNLKQRVKVLVSGEMIAWVIGYRIDERFRIHDKTEKILSIRRQNL
jgi:tRNA(Ile)-lysidine synthase